MRAVARGPAGNLNAIADGFEFTGFPSNRVVLELVGADSLAATRREWFDAFLQIASSHSLLQLAGGRRFFTLIVAGRESSLPGTEFGRTLIPLKYWNPNARRHGFVE